MLGSHLLPGINIIKAFSHYQSLDTVLILKSVWIFMGAAKNCHQEICSECTKVKVSEH